VLTSREGELIDGEGNAALELAGQGDTIREKIYHEGFSEGEKSGMEMERKKVQPLLNDFRQALDELGKVKRDLYRNAERQAVDLALAVARKIVCHEVSVNRELVIGVVKEALERVSDQERIKIRVSPCAGDLLRDPACELNANVQNKGGICIEEDENISSGGCVIETELGDIDARIEEQLSALEQIFKTEHTRCEIQE
jgi:flagellar assembly protein FliH